MYRCEHLLIYFGRHIKYLEKQLKDSKINKMKNKEKQSERQNLKYLL